MWTYVIIGVAVAVVVLLCLGLAVASFSSENFKENWQRTMAMKNSAGINTMEYVDEINGRYFGGRLKLARCPEYQDHYGSGIVALSDSTMSSNSLASLAIVSHELGHAQQDATGDILTKNFRLKKTGRILGFLFMPFLLAGAILCVLNLFGVLQSEFYLILGGCLVGAAMLIFLFVIILRYKAIQIEKDASDKALEFLREILTEQEVKNCKELLDSARLTYWASLLRTMLGWTFLTSHESMFSLIIS